jgi:hypothetical protein
VLIAATEDYARSLHRNYGTISTDPGNTDAQAVYQAMGDPAAHEARASKSSFNTLFSSGHKHLAEVWRRKAATRPGTSCPRRCHLQPGPAALSWSKPPKGPQ